ncbi:tyrosine-protein phosphatase [Butyrivibrio sp. MC2021]|uniref:tyrosine-protein phosphatase n=1 Tax=Butyrivibrio sp. MC2021 TaxID=1408306 RepID=UPI0004797059|nr:CpsB/CapC family capsule biosynthesis tyrosine phosphatase [Butyrivibrio sp. MC2021]
MMRRSPDIKLADMHCHIVPYVDDGASDLEEAKRIIIEEYEQGVRLIVMTVHFKHGSFDTPAAKVKKHFDSLLKWLDTTDMTDLDVYVTREYYCDKRLALLLDGYARGKDKVVYEDITYVPEEEILPFGGHRCILLEFSSGRKQMKAFEAFTRLAVHAGLTPIIAHAERYPMVQENPEILRVARKYGAYIQVNGDAILGKDLKRVCDTARNLIKSDIADIVSSDSHDLEVRSPNLKKSNGFLKSKFGNEVANLLLHDNAYYLVYDQE